MGFLVKQIRPLAVGVLRKENKVLAMKCFDCKKQEVFYRLLGGGIEFGETAEAALKREFLEELGVEIKILRQMGVDESIFTFEGKQGHEIVFFFEVAFRDSSIYQQKLSFIEKEVDKTELVWIELDATNRIYPEGFKKF